MTTDTTSTQRSPKPLSPPITLHEAIDSIAEHIEVPPDWKQRIERCAFAYLPECGFDPENNRLHHVQASLLAGSLNSSWRCWQAAARLHYQLIEAAEQGPKWRNWLGTGFPVLLDPEGRKNALHCLECLSQDSEGRVLAYLDGRFNAGSRKPRSLPPLFSPENQEWLNCLGFECVELDAWLDQAGIPHDLMVSVDADEAMPDSSSVAQPSPSLSKSPPDAEQGFSTATPLGGLRWSWLLSYHQNEMHRRPVSVPEGNEERDNVRIDDAGDFVSLDVVLSAIAARVVVPELAISPGSEKNNWFASVAESYYRPSKAAAILEKYLVSIPADKTPGWYDFRKAEKVPRLNDDARTKGIALLQKYAAWYEQWLGIGQKYGERRADIDRWKQQPVFEKNLTDLSRSPYEDDENMVFSRRVGFDRDEMVGFFLGQRIPNSAVSELPVPLVRRDGEPGVVARSPGVNAGNEELQSAGAEPPKSWPTHAKAEKLSPMEKQEDAPRLSTSGMAAAFCDTDDCMHKTGKDYDGWLAYLQGSLPEWAKSGRIRVHKGNQGKGDTSYWNPFEFARLAVEKTRPKIPPKAFDERFRKVNALLPWSEEWKSREDGGNAA
ncbi:hypothetical protein [Paraburkholderia sp. BCC1885]|uniref:hypothetical protein n=1 Tax=Paraburkholderia sp. BCC1885 TaxID=2562669 RepID=UPI001182BB7E|nr:hypothetical protein [Paraburkholderia sp. BCC1885]